VVPASSGTCMSISRVHCALVHCTASSRLVDAANAATDIATMLSLLLLLLLLSLLHYTVDRAGQLWRLSNTHWRVH
jgi:hypothetical protein